MRSQRLDPLLKIMQQRQDSVARDVAERDRALGEQQERLEALRRAWENMPAWQEEQATLAALKRTNGDESS